MKVWLSLELKKERKEEKVLRAVFPVLFKEKNCTKILALP